MNDWASILPLVLLVLAFLLLVVRPARARQREFQSLQDQLEPGLRVMLASGIFGHIESIDDDTIELRVAPGTVLTVMRQAVSRVVPVEPSTDV
jgi:preprotein translocase subunit YajC